MCIRAWIYDSFYEVARVRGMQHYKKKFLVILNSSLCITRKNMCRSLKHRRLMPDKNRSCGYVYDSENQYVWKTLTFVLNKLTENM